jgi:hypothetical protein
MASMSRKLSELEEQAVKVDPGYTPRCLDQTDLGRNLHTCTQPLGHDGAHTCGYEMCGKVWR